MEWSLGDIIQAFKAVCTSQWQRQLGMAPSVNRPISVDLDSPTVPQWLRTKALQHDNEGALIRSMSQKQRQEYYALVGRQPSPCYSA